MLCLAIGCIHLLPIAAAFGVGVPVQLSWLVVLLCLGSAGRAMLIARSLRRVHLRPHAEGAQLLTPDGSHEGRVLSSSVDFGPLVVLHWQAEAGAKTHYYPLLRDAFCAEDWRLIKVWLRWSVIAQAT